MIELESLSSMNYLIRKWSQVQSNCKKMLWPLIQVNFPLMFCCINPFSSKWYKKRLYDFFYRDVTAFHEVPLTPPWFPSCNITKNAETNPPPMRDVIIEQPHTLLPNIVMNIFKVSYKDTTTTSSGDIVSWLSLLQSFSQQSILVAACLRFKMVGISIYRN